MPFYDKLQNGVMGQRHDFETEDDVMFPRFDNDILVVDLRKIDMAEFLRLLSKKKPKEFRKAIEEIIT